MSWYDAKFGEIAVRRWRGTAIKPYRHLLLSRRSAMCHKRSLVLSVVIDITLPIQPITMGRQSIRYRSPEKYGGLMLDRLIL